MSGNHGSMRDHADGHPGFDAKLHCVCMCALCEDLRTGYCICPDCDPDVCAMHADPAQSVVCAARVAQDPAVSVPGVGGGEGHG